MTSRWILFILLTSLGISVIAKVPSLINYKSTIPDQVLVIKKCCPVNFALNRQFRSCRQVGTGESFTKTLIQSFNSSRNFEGEVNITTGVPSCDPLYRVLVNYQLTTEELVQNHFLPETPFDQEQQQLMDPFCIDSVSDPEHTNDTLWIVRVCRPRAICSEIPCVRKCCDYNEILVPQKNDVAKCQPWIDGPAAVQDINITFYDIKDVDHLDGAVYAPISVFGIVMKQCCNKYKLDPENGLDMYYIDHRNGDLHLTFSEPVQYDKYCVDNTVDTKEGGFTQETFLCYVDNRDIEFYIYSAGLCFSSIFLILTISVYVCSPKLMNLHGKTLVSHLVSLLLTYLGLAYIHHFIDVPYKYCRAMTFDSKSEEDFQVCPGCEYCVYSGFRIRCALFLPKLPGAIGLFTYGASLAAFTWLNVMCFDIWWTLKSVPLQPLWRQANDRKRFLYYSLYGWLVPVLFTTGIHLTIKNGWLVSGHVPGSCWFGSDEGVPHQLLFLLPMGLIFFMNFVLFALTTTNLNRVRRDIRQRQQEDPIAVYSTTLGMVGKLFLVMGLAWGLELVTSLYKDVFLLWLITDFYNVLHGMFVFWIFAFKWTVFSDFRGRLQRISSGIYSVRD